MTRSIQFPDLTKVLNVGDTVYSHIYGKGKVSEIDISQYPIMVTFEHKEERCRYRSFTYDGKQFEGNLFPSIHLQEWNPLTDVFPMQKFEPQIGKMYAFFDNIKDGFVVGRFNGMKVLHIGLYYSTCDKLAKNCLPIDEAIKLFKDYEAELAKKAVDNYMSKDVVNYDNVEKGTGQIVEVKYGQNAVGIKHGQPSDTFEDYLMD